MQLSTRQKNIVRFAGILALAFALVAAVVVAAPYVAPFIVALLFYYMAKPLVRLLSEKLRLPRYLTAVITVIVIVGIVLAVTTLLIGSIVREVQSLINTFPVWSSDLYKWLDGAAEYLQERLDLVHPSVSGALDSGVSSAISWLSGFVGRVASRTWAAVIGIPQTLIFIVATVFCLFFLVADRKKMRAFFEKHAPESWLKAVTEVRDGMFFAFFGYIRAQLVMILITFVELLLAFLILGVDYAVLAALGIALVDMLPAFGAGLFLIPWCIYSFVAGNIKMGVGMMLLYTLTIVVRQSVEPRIIGRNIGVYPMLALVSMYGGLRLWGVLGMLMGPISVILAKYVITYCLRGRPFKEYIDREAARPETKNPRKS